MKNKISNSALFEYDEDHYLLFNYSTFTIIKIEKKFKPLIDHLMSSREELEESITNQLTTEETNNFINSIPNTFFSNKIKFIKKSDYLSRLTFLASTKCNLGCKYCYASEGSYNYGPENMSLNVAQKAIDFFIQNYKGVSRIMFFGGEALLNVPVIEYITAKFEELYLTKKIDFEPQYSLVTNGTILNKKILGIIRKFNFGVSVSIDGDRETHDKARVYKNGKGTYDHVIKNIKKLSQIMNEESLCYECTFSNIHEDKGLTVKDVKAIIESETGIDNGIILPVQGIKENNKYVPNYKIGDKSHKDLQEDYWNKITSGKPVYNNEFRILFNRFIDSEISRYICPIAIEAFSIAPNGDLFPCYLLTDGKNDLFLIGNVTEDHSILKGKINRFKNKMKFLDKAKNDKCKKCFALGLCSFCPALGILYNNNEIPKDFDYYCNRTRKQVSDFIVRITKIRENQEDWNNMNKSIELMLN